jgi:hypothetical protein
MHGTVGRRTWDYSGGRDKRAVSYGANHHQIGIERLRPRSKLTRRGEARTGKMPSSPAVGDVRGKRAVLS